MTNPIIELKNISKKYILRDEKNSLTLAGWFIRSQTEEFWALRGINLSVKKGEAIGIVGSNGAGKSTLLKIIARTVAPTEGKIITSGKIISLINFHAGFNSDLTGRENIFLNGILLGMRRRELNYHLDQIVDFSGLKKFIDSPIFTYSEGMLLRLGLSIALHSEVDILLADDVAYIADAPFRKKIQIKLKELRQKRDLTEIEASNKPPIYFHKYSRIIWLSDGRIKHIGLPSEVIPLYQRIIS